MSLISARPESAAPGQSTHRRHLAGVGHGSGREHFAEDVHVLNVGWRRIQIIVRRKGYVLRQVALKEQAFEVDGDSMESAESVLADEKAARKIGHHQGAAARGGVGKTFGARNGLEQGG